MDTVTFVGFLDGINTSLVTEVDLDSLEESVELDIEIDYEKLYFNMLGAKADWLYDLPEWDSILSEETRKDITTEFRKSGMAVSNKVGRNDPCPCGSGKKYKKCCGK
jgi:preprotein translocase subunit SecA